MTRKKKKHRSRPAPSDHVKNVASIEKLPSTGFLRLPSVLALFPVGRSTFWQGVKEGRYPKPVKLGPRAVGWRVEDIRRLIENGAAA